jgi:signal transduction histidine kinase
LLDLHDHMGLKVLEDVVFTSATARLEFVEVEPSGTRVARSMQVRADDIAQFEQVTSFETGFEFRTTMQSGLESNLIILHGMEKSGYWKSGTLMPLRNPRHLTEALASKIRLADVGRASTSICHELKQPLFTISIAAESAKLLLLRSLAASPEPGMAIQQIDRIAEQIARAHEIIEQTIVYARQDQADSIAADVAEAIHKSHAFLLEELRSKCITVRFELEAGPYQAAITRIGLEQVLVNAFQNAIDSIEARRAQGWAGEGEICVRLAERSGWIQCMVADNGIGLTPGEANSAFLAFFSTKAETGTGLGLYVSRQIIEKAGGSIRLAALPQGAMLELVLVPAASAPEIQSESITMEKRTG